MAALSHRLTCVWFADLVGYTRLAGEDEAAAFRLVQQFQTTARAAAQRYGGRLVKFMGDGALAEFPSTEAAVRAAHALNTDLDRQVRETGADIPSLRIGVHVGDVAAAPDGDLYGDGVNVAARLQTEAEPGQVVVSEEVWRQLRPRKEFRFESLGERALKGIAEGVAVYAVELDKESAAAADEPSALAATGGGLLGGHAAAAAPASSGLWEHIREARFFHVLALYVAGAWLLLMGTNAIRDALELPGWISPVAVILLAVGLVIILATAWVQSHPLTPHRASADEIPGKWEIALGELGRSVTRGEVPHLTWGRAILGGAIAFSLLFGLAGLYIVIQDRGRSFTPADAIAEDAAPGIAVLPFTVNGPGLDVWREGVIDLVSTNIDGAGGLRAIDGRTVLARWSEVVGGSTRPDLATSLEVGRRTGARYVLLGSAAGLGSEVRLVADVYDLTSGQSLGRAQVQGAPDSVYALVDRLSIGVLETILAGKSGSLPQVDLARVTTSSLPALKAYLEAEALFRRSDFDTAIPAYQRAVEADSTFALALYRLSISYGWAERIGSDLSGRYMEQAARFADRLPDRESILVRSNLALERGTLDGLQPLQEGVRKYPDDMEMWYTLGETYYHLGASELVTDAQHDEAWARAIELDPDFAPLYIHPAEVAFHRADSAEANRLARTYFQLAPNGEYTPRFRHTLAFLWGDEATRDRTWATFDTLNTEDAMGVLIYSGHPRFQPIASELSARIRQRDDWNDGFPGRYVRADLLRGDLASALATLDDSRTVRDVREAQLFLMYVTGIPLVPESLTEISAFGTADTLAGFRPFYAAILAAEEGRWAEFDRAAARLQRDAHGLRAEGDSTRLRSTQGMIRAIDGYAAWRRGERERAQTLLEVARREATGYGPIGGVNFAVRYWLGMLALDTGRPTDAVRYFQSFFWADRPLVADRLGQAYERLGEREKAREQYELFITAWSEADPILQPRVVEARQALARLGFAPRG